MYWIYPCTWFQTRHCDKHQKAATDGVNILGRRQWTNILNVIPMFDKYKYNLERQYNLVFNISKSGLFIVLKVFYLWYKLQNRSKKVNVIVLMYSNCYFESIWIMVWNCHSKKRTCFFYKFNINYWYEVKTIRVSLHLIFCIY